MVAYTILIFCLGFYSYKILYPVWKNFEDKNKNNGSAAATN